MCVCDLPASPPPLVNPFRDAWKAYAARDDGRGPYLRFANMLVNDSIYLLDEALKKVQVRRTWQLWWRWPTNGEGWGWWWG